MLSQDGEEFVRTTDLVFQDGSKAGSAWEERENKLNQTIKK